MAKTFDLKAILAGAKLPNQYQKQLARIKADNRRYLLPPTRGAAAASIEGRMRREVVLAFAKP